MVNQTGMENHSGQDSARKTAVSGEEQGAHVLLSVAPVYVRTGFGPQLIVQIWTVREMLEKERDN